jgi:hypothetical protein
MSDGGDSRRATALPRRDERSGKEADDGFAGGRRTCGGLGAFEALSMKVERSIEHAVFGGELGRREFMERVGATTAAAALASVFPVGAAKALAHDKPGALEKKGERGVLTIDAKFLHYKEY